MKSCGLEIERLTYEVLLLVFLRIAMAKKGESEARIST